ncbi:MAG TPA: XRE family transcriptional regulator [Pseudobacteroides sp.]|uniref:XRE family transcriptional regulator n=1 Tax=Pseudobacteroides sp. TaxID=1968840 RepID=UPI002F92A654
MRHFILKKKDIALIDFNLSWNALGEITYQVNNILVNDVLLPYNFKVDTLISWLQHRFVPKNRAFVESILGSLVGNNEPRLISLLGITLGLSLVDDYWVVPHDSSYLWKDYNLYDNNFSEVLALSAFTGHITKVSGVISSPEPTTNGMLRKCWRRINNEVLLYKAGTEGYSNAGKEPYSEYYASQVALAMGLDAVTYDLERWKGVLCSTCKLFTSESLSFISAFDVFGNMPVSEILSNSSDNTKNKLLDLMAFDAVVINEDRHFNNFGFIRSNTTGELLDVAPIFDNGVSLLNYGLDSDLLNLDEYLQSRQMTFAFIPATNLDVVRGYLTSTQRGRLRKLLGFEFKRHSNYNLSEERLSVLTQLVRHRAGVLLDKS